jgi:manganese oxidase
MNKKSIASYGASVVVAIALLLMLNGTAEAKAIVTGITGPTFNLVAGKAYINTPDGDSMLIWGYRDANGGTPIQYPGPTLIVNQGDTVVVTLRNNLPQPSSIVFPGQSGVVATGGTPGLLTNEGSAGGGVVKYRFVAQQPGTYMYHSGTRPELQIEMGLIGALIVRPQGFNPNNPRAYNHPDSSYAHEYLFLLTEMDPAIHDLVDFKFFDQVDNTKAFPVLWFINGRNGIDTLSPDNVPWHPHQPYSSIARTRPGEKVLLRIIGGGRNQHAFHPHGNHSRIIARDGRLLSSAPGSGPDLAVEDFTITPTPGETVDAIFSWTSYGLGWDIYGDPNVPKFAHQCNGLDVPSNGIDPNTGEDCRYHGKNIPVVLPGLQDLSFGGWYSGSPFLGHFGQLPPGEGGLNLNGGIFFMWHSHNEKELTNNDVFPGGMLTFVIIEPPGTPIR